MAFIRDKKMSVITRCTEAGFRKAGFHGGEYWTKMPLDRTKRCIVSNLPVYCLIVPGILLCRTRWCCTLMVNMSQLYYLDVLGQKGRRNLFQLIAWKTKCLTFCFGSVTEHDMLRPIRRGRQLIYKIISLILVKKLNLITDKIQLV